MVDLSGGQDGPLEHAFSNSVFILPGIVVVSLTGNLDSLHCFLVKPFKYCAETDITLELFVPVLHEK